MFVFNSIEELLETLHKNRKLIDFLFGKRKVSISYDELLQYLEYDREKLQRLLDTSILVRLSNSVELQDDLLEFFEKFTDTTEEINVGYINDLILALQKNLRLYEEEKRGAKKDEYLLKIKRNLRTVGKTVLKNVNTLRNGIEDVYATESNYSIKKLNLDDYDEKRSHIDDLVHQLDAFFATSGWEFFIKVARDDELLSILITLKKELGAARKNLIDIAQKIIEFLNQIRQQSEIYKHLQKVKQLKDQFLLQEKTDFEDIVRRQRSLFFQISPQYSIPLSLPLLQSDDGYETLIKVRKKTGRAAHGKLETAEAIADEYFDSNETRRLIIDHNKLKQSFLARGGNLFEFLAQYDFDEALSLDERLTLFCKIASLYRDELHITEQFGLYKNIEYAIVVPNKDSS